MQRAVWVLVGIMLVSFGLAALLGTTLPGAGIGIIRQDIDTRETFDLSGVERLVVETVSTRVTFIPVDGDEITAHFHGWYRGNITGLPELKAVKFPESLKLHIQYQPMRLGFLGSRNVRLDIYIPKTYAGELTVQTVSGDAAIRDLDLKKFRLKTVSGDLKAQDFSASEGIFESTSGDFRVTGLAGQARVDTVSGDIHLIYRDFAHDITLKTTSGNARIELPAAAEFSLSARTVSGQVNVGFSITLGGDSRNVTGVVGSGEHRISSSTVSGDLSIQPLR